VFTKEELLFLVALTQFMPRVLEHSYISHYVLEFKVNKKGSYKVIFSIITGVPDFFKYSACNGPEDEVTKYNLYRAIDAKI
jgi:hypothetical protein